MPAGGLLNRPDVQVVGIVEPDHKLFDSYAQRYHLPASMRFGSIREMVSQVHPQAILVYTNIRDHRRVVEECAVLGVHVMVEKPLAISHKDALAIQEATERGKIHVGESGDNIWVATRIAWPSPTIAWSRLLMAKSLSAGAIPLTTTNRSRCLYRSTSS